MKKTIKCDSLRDYYNTRNKLISDGYIEIPSMVKPEQGENYILFDDPFFSLTTPEKEANTRQEKIGMICCIVMILIALLTWIL
jgi:hypothetical protein